MSKIRGVLDSMNNKTNYILIFGTALLAFFIGRATLSPFFKNSFKTLKPKVISEIDGKEMVLIPAGEFFMGTDKVDNDNTHRKIGTVKPLYLDQQPKRKIFLDNYYIDKYEVTNKEYKRFLDETQFYETPGNWEDGQYLKELADMPVTHVTWYEAFTYAVWAGKRLPTEAQWEKAARGTDGRNYPWGEEYDKSFANMGVDGARKIMPVNAYPKDVSSYGVWGLAGNAMEWTLNWYQAYPGSSYKYKRFGKRFKVIRGNGFQKAGHYFLEAYGYVFFRTEAEPDDYFENVGFRCVTPFIKTN